MSRTAAIYLTELDLTRLEKAAGRAGSHSSLADLVDDLITRANVVPSDKIPADVVTMNSAVRVVDDAGVEQEWTLVYPEEANVASAKLSVLSPMGAALLGARAGKSVKYTAPNGAQRTLTVKAIVFQPEASGQHTL